MSSAILSNDTTSRLPALAFATPAPSPGLVLLRRRERAANKPPPLLKRKRTPSISSTCSSDDDEVAASYLPTLTNFPILDCENFGNGREGTQTNGGSASSIPLPNIMLFPRTKRSGTGCFISSSPQDHHQSNYEFESKRARVNSARKSVPTCKTEENDNVTKNTDETTSTSLIRTSSSKNMLTGRPSMNLPRTLSLQFNSFLNLAAAATNNGASDGCPLSASTSSLIPQRKSFLNIPRSSSSSHLDANENREQNIRRSPVATTLDYFASAMRFPDVSIGVSI